MLHACYPALTLIPNLFVSGAAAALVGLGMAIWAVFFVERPGAAGWCWQRYPWWLLVGGGFVPVFVGLVAAAAASRLHAPPKPGGRGWRILAALWPWPLALMAIWFGGSWLLGALLGPAMLAASGLLFLVFDVGLPLLAALSGFALAKRR